MTRLFMTLIITAMFATDVGAKEFVVEDACGVIGNPERLLTPDEQAWGRARSTPLDANIKFWTKKFGQKRAAELVDHMYDKNGMLLSCDKIN
jgi:hypothetical protein